MTTKMKLAFLVFVMILAMPFLLACDDGPAGIVTERTNVEQGIIDHVRENSNQSLCPGDCTLP